MRNPPAEFVWDFIRDTGRMLRWPALVLAFLLALVGVPLALYAVCCMKAAESLRF